MIELENVKTSQLKHTVLHDIIFLCSYFIYEYTGLFEMTVGVLTTCHTQYTSDSSM
jgi:hypothetical protein